MYPFRGLSTMAKSGYQQSGRINQRHQLGPYTIFITNFSHYQTRQPDLLEGNPASELDVSGSGKNIIGRREPINDKNTLTSSITKMKDHHHTHQAVQLHITHTAISGGFENPRLKLPRTLAHPLFWLFNCRCKKVCPEVCPEASPAAPLASLQKHPNMSQIIM